MHSNNKTPIESVYEHPSIQILEIEAEQAFLESSFAQPNYNNNSNKVAAPSPWEQGNTDWLS